MIRTLTLATLVLSTLTVTADETQKPAVQKSAPVQPAVSTAPAPVDSPMVAAAKRAKRLGKKPAHVITNATIQKQVENPSGKARITTTTNQGTLKLPPVAPSQELVARQIRLDEEKRALAAADAVAKARETEELKRSKRRTSAASAEDGGYFDETDPSQAEKAAAEAARAQTQEQKPPQQ